MLAEAALLVALSVQHAPGTESCMSAARLERGVERRLKRKVFVEAQRADLSFAVSFSKRGGELEARIVVSSIDGTPRGVRVLVTSSHCSALDDSLALSVALLVDQPPEPELPPEPAPVPEAGRSALIPRPPAPPAAPRPIWIPPDVAAPREPWHASVGASAAAIWGALPGIAPGVAVFVTLRPRHFLPTILMGEAWRTATAERDAEAGARFRLLRAGIALCPALLEAAERGVNLCFGQKLGWLSVAGYGFDHDARERRLTFALSAGLEARLRLFSLFILRSYLGTEVPLVRDQFASGGPNPAKLFQPSPVAVDAQVGLEAQLW